MENIVVNYKNLSIVVLGVVMDKIKNYIQTSLLETGGILYGFKIKEKEEYIISGFTKKQDLDKVSKCSYNRLDPMHFILIKEYWKNDKSIMYLGDWHYHPVNYIVPSQTDYQTFENISKESVTSSKYLFYIIISEDEFGLYVYEKRSGTLIHTFYISI